MDIEKIKKSFSGVVEQCKRVIDRIDTVITPDNDKYIRPSMERFRNSVQEFGQFLQFIGALNDKAKLSYLFREIIYRLDFFCNEFKSFLFDELDDENDSKGYALGVEKLKKYISNMYEDGVSNGSLMLLCAKDFIDSFDEGFSVTENKDYINNILNFVNDRFSQKDFNLDADYVVELTRMIAEFLAVEGLGDKYNIDGDRFGSGVGALNNIFISLMRLRFECDEYIRINNIENSAQQDHWISQSPESMTERIKKLYAEVQNADSSASKIISKLEKRLEESSVKFSLLEENLKSKFQEFTKKFEGYDQQLEILIGKSSPGQTEVSAQKAEEAYKERGNEEKGSANNLRLIAFCSLSVGVVLALCEIWFGNVFSTNWKELLARLTITSILVGISAYSARESSKHRAMQHAYERLSLDFTAFRPFISTLDKEHKVELIKLMATKTFIERDVKAEQVSGAEINHELIQDVIAQLKKALQTTKNEKV